MKFADDSVIWVHTGTGTDLGSVLNWDSDDPFAIRVTFLNQPVTVDWLFARELVMDAIRTGEAGEGDVLIQMDGNTLTLSLTSPFGAVTMKTPADAIRKFLDQTFEAVPLGEENAEAAIDMAILQFLEEDS